VRDLLHHPNGGLDLDRDQPQVRSRIEPSGEFHTLRDYAPRRPATRSLALDGGGGPLDDAPERSAPAHACPRDARRSSGAYDRASFERAVEACASSLSAIDAPAPVEVVLGTA